MVSVASTTPHQALEKEVFDYYADHPLSISTTTLYWLVECESGWDITSTNRNKNGTIDWGLFQINDIHFGEAESMGLNPRIMPDNMVYAFHLIERNRLADYTASRVCRIKNGSVE